MRLVTSNIELINYSLIGSAHELGLLQSILLQKAKQHIQTAFYDRSPRSVT